MPKPYPDTHEVQAAIRAIGALSELFNIADTLAEEWALYAFTVGRPAYWRTVGYGNQALGNLMDDANRLGLEAALAARPDGTTGASAPLYLLGCLVPLNAQARFELNRLREAETAKRDHEFVKTTLAPEPVREAELV
jgi:hypothetical protein